MVMLTVSEANRGTAAEVHSESVSKEPSQSPLIKRINKKQVGDLISCSLYGPGWRVFYIVLVA